MNSSSVASYHLVPDSNNPIVSSDSEKNHSSTGQNNNLVDQKVAQLHSNESEYSIDLDQTTRKANDTGKADNLNQSEDWKKENEFECKK